jgi:hypothetical protein
MRTEYNERLESKGAGQEFHSLKKEGDEIGYVDDLVRMVNAGVPSSQEWRMTGHLVKWHEAYARRRVRQQAIFGRKRDSGMDEAVLSRVPACS